MAGWNIQFLGKIIEIQVFLTKFKTFVTNNNILKLMQLPSSDFL